MEKWQKNTANLSKYPFNIFINREVADKMQLVVTGTMAADKMQLLHDAAGTY